MCLTQLCSKRGSALPQCAEGVLLWWPLLRCRCHVAAAAAAAAGRACLFSASSYACLLKGTWYSFVYVVWHEVFCSCRVAIPTHVRYVCIRRGRSAVGCPVPTPTSANGVQMLVSTYIPFLLFFFFFSSLFLLHIYLFIYFQSSMGSSPRGQSCQSTEPHIHVYNSPQA